jgi:hypothetical protein
MKRAMVEPSSDACFNQCVGYAKSFELGDVWGEDAGEAGGRGLLLSGGPLARVHTLSSEFEAHVLSNALHVEGIEAVVQTYRELAFDGLFVPQRGWGCIVTRVEEAERALEVITATLATIPPRNDDEPGAG